MRFLFAVIPPEGLGDQAFPLGVVAVLLERRLVGLGPPVGRDREQVVGLCAVTMRQELLAPRRRCE